MNVQMNKPKLFPANSLFTVFIGYLKGNLFFLVLFLIITDNFFTYCNFYN